MTEKRGVVLAAGLLAALTGAGARAAEIVVAPPARFAVILGVNKSVDADTPPLRYADDDAAGYLDLFRTLGARTYLLSRFDDNTRRLHPQAVAEAEDPRVQELDRILQQVAADVATAGRRHIRTVLYFVYAGHGNVEDGRGYLALEDGRLYGADLERLVLDRVRAEETHFIVDACYSAFLAFSRGPGGERRETRGFSTLGGLASRPGVGLLLSTSSARESHEWSEFQAGVFSHEVRSGLLGAADADGDGQVTYREIAAFIERANAAIPNEKLRPDVYVRQPQSSAALLDLRPGLGRRLELTGDHPGHYLIEDGRGVRLADFHNAPGQPLHLIRLASTGPLYLRRVGAGTGDGEEYVMDAAPAVLRFADLRAGTSGVQPRGAANESFRLLFSLPFSQQVVDAFEWHDADVEVAQSPVSPERPARHLRRPVAFGLLAFGAVFAGLGTWEVVSALDAKQQTTGTQAQTFAANQTIAGKNDWARALYGVSVAALAPGALLLLWPKLTESRAMAFTFDQRAGGAVLGWGARF
jgi:hypothetical protein